MSYLTVKGDVVTRPERQLVKQLAERMVRKFGPGLKIVNIGIGPGATLHCLQAGAPRADITGIDKLQRRMVPDAAGSLHATLIRGDSNDPEVQAQFLEPLHIVLVDGGHHYEIVKGDIYGCGPKVVKGGIMIFHDYGLPPPSIVKRCPWVVEVRQAVDEWQERSNCWRRIATADKVIAFERVR